MKLEKIIIKNFRNYFEEVELDLSKDIIVIYGANGFGKSTLFDAIEWCLTGKINRFEGEETELKKDITNKYNQEKDIEVSITLFFENNQLNRKFNVSNNKFSPTRVFLKKADGDIIRGKTRVENHLKKHLNPNDIQGKERFNDFLKQSNILSQQQINSFVTSDSSKERFVALGNIVGLKAELNEFKNFKKVLEQFKRKNDEVLNEIQAIRQQITVNEEAVALKSLENRNQLPESYNEYFESEITDKLLDTEITNRLLNVEKIGRNLSLINDFNDLDKNCSLFLLFKILNQNQNQTNKDFIKLEKMSKLTSRLQNKILLLNEYKSKVTKVNNIKKELLENQKNIKDLGIDSISIEVLNGNMSELRNQMAILRYNINYNEFLNNNIDNNKQKQIDLQNDIGKKYILEKKLARTKLLSENLKKNINDNQETLLSNLISGIKDIKKFTQNSNLDYCPVCTSQVNDFSSTLDDQLRHYISNLNEEASKYERVLSSQKFCVDRIERIKKQLKRITSEINELKKSILEFENEAKQYEASDLFSEKFKFTPLNDLKNIYSAVETKLDKQKKVLDLTLKRTQLLNDLKMYEKSSVISTRIKSDIEISNEIETNANRIANLEEKLTELHLTHKENVKLNSNRASHLEALDKELTPNQKKITLASLYYEFEVLKRKLEKEIDDFKLVQEILINREINKSIYLKINGLEKLEKKLITKQLKIYSKLELLENQRNLKQEILGDGISGWLNQSKSTVQRFFRYLDPLPSNSELIFDGNDEKINIKIAYNRESKDSILNLSNAKNVLSSGQLNILALSIFLAVNKDQKIHSFDFIGIDDPIQNMDDINQYTVCDVLSSIQKQLIISTHDFNFLKLFYKKNHHRKNNMIIYNLDSPYISKKKISKLKFLDDSPIIS